MGRLRSRRRPFSCVSDRESGRGDRIRTCDILLPKQARYQTAPLPDAGDPLGGIVGSGKRANTKMPFALRSGACRGKAAPSVLAQRGRSAFGVSTMA